MPYVHKVVRHSLGKLDLNDRHQLVEWGRMHWLPDGERDGPGSVNSVSAPATISVVSSDAFWPIVVRLQTTLGLSRDEIGRVFGVDADTVERWRDGLDLITSERFADFQEVADSLNLLEATFLPDRLPDVIRRPASLFDGERALDWILRGRIKEVAERYDRLLMYQT